MKLRVALHGEPGIDGGAPKAAFGFRFVVAAAGSRPDANLYLLQQPRGRESGQVDAESEAGERSHGGADDLEAAGCPGLEVGLVLLEPAVEASPRGAHDVDPDV